MSNRINKIDDRIKKCQSRLDMLDIELLYTIDKAKSIKIISKKMQLEAYIESLEKLKYAITTEEKEEIQLKYEIFKEELQHVTNYICLNIDEQNEENVNKLALSKNTFDIIKYFEKVINIKKIKIYKKEYKIKLIAA